MGRSAVRSLLAVLVVASWTIGICLSADAAASPEVLREQMLAACADDFERTAVSAALEDLGLGPPEGAAVQVLTAEPGRDPCGTLRHLILAQIAHRLGSAVQSELAILAATPAHLDDHLESDHFQVWYTDDSPGHPEDVVTTAYAQQVLQYLERSYSTKVEQWDYWAGASRDNGSPATLFQVWIHDLGGAYGETFDFVANPAAAPGNDEPRTFCKIGVAPGVGDDSLLLSTCAHEYHHASQASYMDFEQVVTNAALFQQTVWLIEASAPWAEYEVRKQHSDVAGTDCWGLLRVRMEHYQDNPWNGLQSTDVNSDDHSIHNRYDGALLFYFLANNTVTGSLWPGHDQRDVVRRFWECLSARADWAEIFDAFDDALADADPCLDTFAEVFGAFAAANLLDDDCYPRSDEVTSDTDFASAALEWDDWPVIPHTIAGAAENPWSADYIRTWYVSLGFLLRSDFEGEGASDLGLMAVRGELARVLPVRPAGDVRTAAWETGMPSSVDHVDYVITRTQPGGTGEYELAVAEIDPPSIGAALDWLRLQQGPTGAITESPGCGCSVGKTAIAVLGMLNNGDAPCDPTVGAALRYLLSAAWPDGSIGYDLPTYETSLAVLALVAARQAGYEPPAGLPALDPAIVQAADWLVDGQNLEGDFMANWYGGWGYYANYSGWSDLSNTQFPILALEAAYLAGLYPALPASLMEGTGTFVSRCWNDPVKSGSRSVCGGMTGAALWCLEILGRHGLETLQVTTEASAELSTARQSALDWLLANPSVTENPGAATYYGDPLVYYYYYLYSAAKAYILADAGEAWYDDLVAHLGSIQSAAGSMPATWNESEVLATEWAALALETRAGPPPGVSQELWIVLNSPADLYVTDPLGRHIGADPVTHDPVNEIPDATYSGPGTEPQEIVIPDPVRGTYLIDVLGTATGAYTLSMIGVSGGEQVSQAVATGTTAPGVIDPYDAVVTSVTSPLDIFLSPAEIEFVEATVELHPRSLNLKRTGNWVTCYIELPPGFAVESIDTSSLLLQGGIPCEPRPISVGDEDQDGIPDLMVKFDCWELIQLLSVGEAGVTLTGQLMDATEIAGADVISVHEGSDR
jgi:hypothetical protein